MQLPPRLARPFHCHGDGRVLGELAGGDLGVDAGNIHLHDAPGADVQVADLAVAHLPVWQADKVVAGLDERVGIFAQQLVVGWLAGQCNGVVGGFDAIAPSIEDGQNERTLEDGHVSIP